jgi:hypothetical protein
MTKTRPGFHTGAGSSLFDGLPVYGLAQSGSFLLDDLLIKLLE